MIGPWLFKKPWVAGAIILAMLLPAAAHLPFVEFASLRVFQNDRREAQKVLDAIGRRFVPEDILIAAYQSADVFAPRSLALDRVLSRELAAMRVPLGEGRTASVAFDVFSLSNVKDAFGTNTAFSMHPLIEDPIPTDAASIEHTRRRAHANPLIAANLISGDDRVAAIMIRVNPFLDDAGLVRAVKLIQARLDQVSAETGVPFHLMGHAVTEAEFQTYALRDLVRYTPVTAVVALLLCFAFTFSWWSTFALGTIILAADLVALGVMPLLGFRYSPLSVAIAPASIILATSTVVHFMGEAGNSLYGEHRSWEVVRVQVFREVLRPSFMCCLFTGIGFFSVYVSEVQAIREFGISAAIVTGTTFVITVLGVALWWSWWPVELFVRRGSPAVSSSFQSALSRMCGVIIDRPAHTLAVSVVALTIVGGGMYFLRIDENALEYYPTDSPVRIANEFIETHLGGTEVFSVIIEKTEPGAFTDPAELRKLDGFAHELRELAHADVVETVADQLKLMRQAVYSEDPAEARIPDTQQQVRTLLAISGEERIHELLDRERRAVRISVRTRVHGTQPLSQIFARIETRLQELYPDAAGHRSMIVGISKVFVETTDLIARAEVESLSLTCVLIVGLLMIMLRSVSVGFLTILPNLIPLFMVMGFMGWTGKPITVGNSMLCSIAFGVAVEDTIHLIEGYRERLRMGYSIQEAVDYSFRVKAPAGIWTSVVLACGFLAIGFASFQPVSDFGLLLSLAVTTSLAGNLIILPATILIFRCRAGIKAQGAQTEPEVRAWAAAGKTLTLCWLLASAPAPAFALDPALKSFDPADRDSTFDRPPEGCLDMDDPRAKNPDDPRRLKYGVKICCLDPADPRAKNPDEARFKKYGIQMCCLKPDHPWAQNVNDPRMKKWGVKMCCLPPEHPWAQNPDDERMKRFDIQLCCIPPEHPWAQNPDDPRIRQFNVKLCCLKPDHPWARAPDDPRRKRWKVDMCGPDIRALTRQSNLRHFLDEELTDVELVMLAKDGSKQVQSGRMARTQDQQRDEERLWYHFLAPSDIKGLTLLTLDTRSDGVQQWLYLPAFGRVRRLSSADLKEQFGATDYIYEDLKRHVPDDYHYTFLEMQGAGAEEAYVFQATPRPDGMAKDSPYGKLKVWLRKSDLFVLRVQEFDRQLEPWKELRFEDVVEVTKSGAKRSNRIICMDIKRKHQTAVITTRRKVGAGAVLSSWLNPSTFHLE